MSSRDGVHWHRFMEAFIRPGRDRRNWIHRNGLVARGIVPTAPGEISLYTVQHYTYPSAHLQRVVVRTDGFASASAGYPGGELITKPFRFSGENLILNYSTSAAGSIRVEIQDGQRQPGAGSLTDRIGPIWGDELEGEGRGGFTAARFARNRSVESPERRSACASSCRTPISIPSGSGKGGPTRRFGGEFLYQVIHGYVERGGNALHCLDRTGFLPVLDARQIRGCEAGGNGQLARTSCRDTRATRAPGVHRRRCA